MAKKYMVTGGAGFIGSHLVEKLLDRGDQVVVVDNFNDYYNPLFKERNVSNYSTHHQVQLHRMDVTDLEKMRELFAQNQFDTVVHLAARAGVRESRNIPHLYIHTNDVGTTNLLELARLRGIKNFIFASSSSIYGNQQKTPFSETDEVNHPVSVYAASKRAGELLGHTYHALYNLNFWALRFFTVYGERGRPDMAPYSFTKAVLEDRELTRFGEGKLRRDFTYIDDIVDGIVGAIDNIGRVGRGYEIINLGNNQPITVNEFIAIIENELGKKAKIIDQPKPTSDVDITYADIAKAQQLFGFKPKIGVAEGMKKFVDWFKKQSHT